MEIRTFWRIVIKGIGLWLLIGAFYIIPQLGSNLYMINTNDGWSNIFTIFILSVFLFVVYIFIVRLFLFKSEYIITKLKLDSHFTQEKIDVNISSQTVLRVVIIITGAITLIESLPNFMIEVYHFLQAKQLLKDYQEVSSMLFYFIKSLIAYLMMTNSKVIEKYISREAKKV